MKNELAHCGFSGCEICDRLLPDPDRVTPDDRDRALELAVRDAVRKATQTAVEALMPFANVYQKIKVCNASDDEFIGEYAPEAIYVGELRRAYVAWQSLHDQMELVAKQEKP